MKKNHQKYKIYFKKYKKLIDEINISLIKRIEESLKKYKSSKKRVFLFGNGGSASISAHVSTDLVKMCKIKAVTFNEANFITCFAATTSRITSCWGGTWSTASSVTIFTRNRL